MASDQDIQQRPNSLTRLAAAGGVVLGGFLLLGAYGHFIAVWPVIGGAVDAPAGSRIALLLPGLILATTGLVNIGLCRMLWPGVTWSVNVALVFNAVTTLYLIHLLRQDVPEHPIGIFLAMVSSYLVLLSAIRAGLVWPATRR